MEPVDLREFRVVDGKLVANLPPEPVAALPEPEDKPSCKAALSRNEDEDVGWRMWD
jgi:hypothetical protein